MGKKWESDCAGLPEIAIVGRFTNYPGGQTPNEHYLHYAFRRLGVPAKAIDRADPGWPNRTPVKGVVIFAGPHCTERFATKIRARMNRVIFWTLDVPDAFGRLSLFRECAQNSDTVFSSADWTRFGIVGRNKRCPLVRIPAAVPGDRIEFNPMPRNSVGFLGTCYSLRRRQIAGLVKDFRGRAIVTQHEKLFGKRLVSFVQETKIIIGDNWMNDHPGYWSSRNYIIPGSGGFLLTAHVPGIENEFVPGKHLVTWRDLKDMRNKIRYYLAHDKERERIRRAGYEFTQACHRWECRAKEMIGAIRKIMR